MTFDDAFAVLDGLSRQPDAFTTGTAANGALASWATSMLASLQAAEASAETAIASASLGNPAAVLAAVTTAGNAAGAHASLVELTNLQTVLNRP